MNKDNMPISIHKIALLQAYLYEIFNLKNQCTQSFSNTIWYLRENHSEAEINEILEFLKSKNANCDCEILTNLDLRDLAKEVISTHGE
jgi:hypothetical protein